MNATRILSLTTVAVGSLVFSVGDAKPKHPLPPRTSRWHAAPLKGSFMITAMLGVLISAFWVFPQSFNYGITFIIIFTIMFIASLISMTKGPAIEK